MVGIRHSNAGSVDTDGVASWELMGPCQQYLMVGTRLAVGAVGESSIPFRGPAVSMTAHRATSTACYPEYSEDVYTGVGPIPIPPKPGLRAVEFGNIAHRLYLHPAVLRNNQPDAGQTAWWIDDIFVLDQRNGGRLSRNFSDQHKAPTR